MAITVANVPTFKNSYNNDMLHSLDYVDPSLALKIRTL
jgi:hypothetical protein